MVDDMTFLYKLKQINNIKIKNYGTSIDMFQISKNCIIFKILTTTITKQWIPAIRLNLNISKPYLTSCQSQI